MDGKEKAIAEYMERRRKEVASTAEAEARIDAAIAEAKRALDEHEYGGIVDPREKNDRFVSYQEKANELQRHGIIKETNIIEEVSGLSPALYSWGQFALPLLPSGEAVSLVEEPEKAKEEEKPKWKPGEFLGGCLK